jgi:TRAP-type C4-dicarboxylate transport system substrate-binding protein
MLWPTRLVLSLAFLLALHAGVRGDTFKLATIAPKDSPYYDILHDMVDAWRAASEDRIDIKIYAGNAVGDEADIVRKMRVGQFQIAAISGGGLPDILPELRALQMPMMFASDEERDYVFDRIHPSLEALALQRGFKVLAWSPAGWLYFFTQRPVVTPDDLRPLGIFAWAGKSGYIEAWKAAGFRPVALPVNEILTSLETGFLNAVAVPPIAALSFQWFGLANHMTNLKWAPLDGAIIMPLKDWQRIPAALQPQLLASAQAAGARLDRSIARLNDTAIEVMKRHNLIVHDVSPALREEWERRARLGYPRLIGDTVPEALYRQVEQLRDEYRATHAAP